MTTLTQSRVSPAAAGVAATSITNTTTTKEAPAECGVLSSSSSSKNKSRFLRRKRTSSTTTATTPTFTRSHSSCSQLSSMDGSHHNGQMTVKQKKKRSLLKRLLLGKGGVKKSLVIETTPAADDAAVREENPPLPLAATATQAQQQPQPQSDDDDEDFTEIDLLEEQGQQLRLCGQTDDALATWQEALQLAQPYSACKSNQLKCRMIDLHLRAADDATHLEQAKYWMRQLEPLQTNDNSANCLQPSRELLELLMEHACWTFALQVSHQMPEPTTSPLTLARLHLEVALQQPRDRPLVHLSECHQLLLSSNSSRSDDDRQVADALWQELAQAYGNLGQEELAVGCSQSRMQHETSRPQIALAHYDQALNVYSPVGQYGLALKEAELGLDALSHVDEFTQEDAAQVQQEQEEAELLRIKLYQFKADVLCRMGRINDSIQSYQQLLQAHQESTTHGPVDAANVLYILGKLSVRCKRFRAALEYFDQELEMTKSVVGRTHLAISKIYHEQAKVAEAGMMDYPLAIHYYEMALRVESGVYQQARQQQQSQGATLASSTLLQEARAQMGETKQSLGKLHFKMGDFATAVRTSLAVDK